MEVVLISPPRGLLPSTQQRREAMIATFGKAIVSTFWFARKTIPSEGRVN
jgi:hypothetical protein